MDAWRTPKLVLRAHLPDQRVQFHLDSRAPSPRVRFPTPIATKAGPVPPHEGLGPNDCENLQDRRKPAIQLDKEPAIMVRQTDATMQPTPQDNQLMSKHRILSLKPHLRLERRGQDGQDKTQKPDHSVSLGDSITSSARIEFSVHTTILSELSTDRRHGDVCHEGFRRSEPAGGTHAATSISHGASAWRLADGCRSRA